MLGALKTLTVSFSLILLVPIVAFADRMDEKVPLAYQDADGNRIVYLELNLGSPDYLSGFYWWPKDGGKLYELRTRDSFIDFNERQPTHFDFFEPDLLPNEPFAWTRGDLRELDVTCRHWPRDGYAKYSALSDLERQQLGDTLATGAFEFAPFPEKSYSAIRTPLYLFRVADPRSASEDYIYVDRARWFEGPVQVAFITVEAGRPVVTRTSMAHDDERTGVINLNDGSQNLLYVDGQYKDKPYFLSNRLLGQEKALVEMSAGDRDALAKLGIDPYARGQAREPVHTPCEPLLKP